MPALRGEAGRICAQGVILSPPQPARFSSAVRSPDSNRRRLPRVVPDPECARCHGRTQLLRLSVDRKSTRSTPLSLPDFLLPFDHLIAIAGGCLELCPIQNAHAATGVLNYCGFL